MLFAALGALSVDEQGVPVDVPAGKQRVILAALIVNANQVVSFDRLAKYVWVGSPPVRWRVVLRNYVMRLRRVLGPEAGARVITSAPGYVLRAGDDEVDLLRFAALYRSGARAVQSHDWQQVSSELRAALELWRAEPLVDVPSETLRQEVLPELGEQYLQAAEWAIEADLHLGRHEELVAELQALTAEHPLRERFHAQLMTALYRCGRQAEALAAYRQVRSLLVHELGVEPGPELQQLHQRLLAGDSALTAQRGTDEEDRAVADRSGPVLPQQLPAAVRHFTGRVSELQVLTGLLDEVTETNRTVVISTIAGTGGIGKTTLAVHWAHQAAKQFPDGQLYVNLRGFEPSGTPVAPTDAIRGFLDALGVPGDRVPPSLEEQVGLYRSLLAGKRILIILDNVRDVEQVRPLLPGSSTCLVMVTSRSQLTGLTVAEGARLITLDLLSVDEARDILVHHLGSARVTAEPDAVDELIELCERLPLALCIAAARAAAQSRLPLSALVEQLRTGSRRLDVLDTGDATTNVRAVVSGSYRYLDAPATRVFRLLGMQPGVDISLPAIASLADMSPDQVYKAVDELTRYHLLLEHVPSRFSFHDLLRTYAAERVQIECDEQERSAATHRLLDYYLHTAKTAAQLLNPDHDPISLQSPLPGVQPGDVVDRAHAVAWFDTEHRVLLAATAWAADSGFDTHAWQIPLTLVNFFNRCGHWHDAAATLRIALVAATRLGDAEAQARAHCELGRPLIRLGALEDAQAHLQQALDLYRWLGDSSGQARAQLALALFFEQQRDYGQAVDQASQALELYRLLGHQSGKADALNAVGWYSTLAGDYQQALIHGQEALELYRQLGNQAGEADAWHSLAFTHHCSGDYREALNCYRHAGNLDHELGHRFLEAETLTRIGDTHHIIGDLDAARSVWQQAVKIFDELNNPDADRIRKKLRELGLDGSGSIRGGQADA